jgi:phage antirepressor YoqD-like protein
MAASTKDPITVKELAEQLKVEPKDLRVWLRSEGKGSGGKGKRYEFTPKQATELKRKFKAAEEADAE